MTDPPDAVDKPALLHREGSTTPDLVKLARAATAAGSSGDLDTLMSFWALDAVWDLSPVGIGTFEGQAAIRGFVEDWIGSYDDLEIEVQEMLDLGNGVVFVLNRLKGRLAGSTAETQLRQSWVQVWVGALIVRQISYLDIDEARADAERLAKSRG